MRARISATAVAAALLLAGCGEGAGVAIVPPDGECLESWNSSAAALTFGQHVYRSHQSLRAHVYKTEVGPQSPNIKAQDACAAIFAVISTDAEFGDVGLVETDLGWASMTEIDRANPDRWKAMQEEADRAANTTLFEDGRLADSQR